MHSVKPGKIFALTLSLLTQIRPWNLLEERFPDSDCRLSLAAVHYRLQRLRVSGEENIAGSNNIIVKTF